MVIVEKAIRYAPRGVVGIDIAGPRPGGERYDYAALAGHVAAAREAGLGVTIHVGEEGGSFGLAEVAEVVESLRPDRIGHGILAARDPALMARLREAGIVLEVCPTSNLLTKALAGEDEVRSTFRAFVDHGVPFTIATDGPEMMRTHLRDEFELLLRIGALDEAEARAANERGHEASFIGRRAAARGVVAAGPLRSRDLGAHRRSPRPRSRCTRRARGGRRRCARSRCRNGEGSRARERFRRAVVAHEHPEHRGGAGEEASGRGAPVRGAARAQASASSRRATLSAAWPAEVGLAGRDQPAVAGERGVAAGGRDEYVAEELERAERVHLRAVGVGVELRRGEPVDAVAAAEGEQLAHRRADVRGRRTCTAAWTRSGRR